eukprot:TRINITY_DN6575_c0_g1_i1.p1 TRINITY_DN6575_c0_g1~~TRINITY_DN6575_c0_g1_i1.p1  ORF type:complete len:481 (-),score=57.41 TRINITY_DN6575_c0_g1_i1:149-1570(-)
MNGRGTKRRSQDDTSSKKPRNLGWYHNIMLRMSNHRDVAGIERIFAELVDLGLQPTAVTYSLRLNAHVRAGDSESVPSLFDGIPQECRSLAVNTVLIKALCSCGRLSAAQDALNLLLISGSEENPEEGVSERTLHTFLRACLSAGDFTRFLAAYEAFKRPEDALSLQYLCNCFSLLGKTRDAWATIRPVVERSDRPNTPAAVLTLASTLSLLSLAAAASGHPKRASLAGATCQDVLGEDGGQGICASPYDRFVVDEACRRLEVARSGNTPAVLPIVHRFAEKKGTKAVQKMLAAHTGPILIDIGAGVGDWMCERLRCNDGLMGMAVELRFDHLAEAAWTAALTMPQAADRVVLCQGDANLLPTSKIIPEESISDVHMNFPEPRTIHLDAAFFQWLGTVLIPGGRFHLLTDNNAVAATMDAAVAAEGTLPARLRCTRPELPRDYGSSVFDRFWRKGNHTTRHYFVVVRTEGESK